MDKVLDPKYTTISPDERVVFDRKQAFMYTVLARILQTDKGKQLVCDYTLDYNTQKIFHKLETHTLKYTIVSID